MVIENQWLDLYEMQENGIWHSGYIESFILDGFKYVTN